MKVEIIPSRAFWHGKPYTTILIADFINKMSLIQEELESGTPWKPAYPIDSKKELKYDIR